MIAAKLITPLDVSHFIQRYDWVSGVTYAQYDPTDGDLHRSNFYVLTDEFNVYKVIDNAGGIPSTVKPTGQTASIFTTADGYSWKFMYNIDTNDAQKFLTTQFMPVKNILGNAALTGPGLQPYPVGGHGADNIKELGAYFVGINIRLEFDEGGDFTVKNDYRKVGLLQNPFLFGTQTIATDFTYRQTTRFTVASVGGTFLPDEIVQGATAGDTARVVEFDAVNNFLYVQIITGTFVETNGVTGQTSSAIATISAIQNPGLEEYTGEMLYIETRTPIPRDTAQTESISIVLQF
jgi:hypothetical protein